MRNEAQAILNGRSAGYERARQSARDFFAAFSAEAHDRFLNGMERHIGHRYRLSTTPFFLEAERLERLVETAHAILRLLQTERYQTETLATPWFLPQRPMTADDFFGDVEFHVGPDAEHFIEVNIGQPGHIGLMGILESEFLKAFPIADARRMNENFERDLADAVTDGGRYRSIAIAVNHTPASAAYLPHYRYIESVIARSGAEARMVYARDVAMVNGAPTWDGRTYERVFSLVIPRIWQDNPEAFAGYTRAFTERPELFFVNPIAWKVASKGLLPICWNLPNDDYGLDAASVRAIHRASIETYRLSDFSRAEEIVNRFGDTRNVVVKAPDNYHGKELLLRPSAAQLAALIDERPSGHVVQRFVPAGTIPTIARDGSIADYLFSLRVCFLRGKFCGLRGYNFTLPPSEEDLVPVVVVGS